MRSKVCKSREFSSSAGSGSWPVGISIVRVSPLVSSHAVSSSVRNRSRLLPILILSPWTSTLSVTRSPFTSVPLRLPISRMRKSSPCRRMTQCSREADASVSESWLPTDVRLHQHDVGAGDEAMDAAQFFEGSPHQLFGIISLDDRHLGQSRIKRHRVTALCIHRQRVLGPYAAFAEPVSEACGSGSDSSHAEQFD